MDNYMVETNREELTSIREKLNWLQGDDDSIQRLQHLMYDARYVAMETDQDNLYNQINHTIQMYLVPLLTQKHKLSVREMLWNSAINVFRLDLDSYLK